MNLIKQIVRDGEYGTQTIKMIVRSNERGAQGEPGPQGDAATIRAGKAYSVPATQEPAVINSGTSSDAVFDFYIPHGSVGWGDITGNINAQEDLVPYLNKADSALQPDDVDYDVMQDLSVSSNGSTSVLQLDANKVNLKTGATSTKNIPLTVASSTKAGVMNSATFDAVQANSSNIQTILGGMVAVNGLSSTPTQAELTTAWEQASGLDTPSNYSKILDIDNSKYWTYYDNLSSWYASSADIQVSVSPFTNSSAGIIMGSTTEGQVYAESNGTGSVNGWDTLSAAVNDNTANKLATSNLSASGGLTETVTGSGANTSIDMAISDGGVSATKIADNAVTGTKIADRVVNNKLWTTKNLAPTADTTTAWKNLFNSTDGVYWTKYDIASMFTNQPQRYGLLETILSSGELYQRWHNQAGGVEMYRSGNATGWNGSASGSGVFKKIYDSSQINTALAVTGASDTSSVGSTEKWLNPSYTIPSDGLYFIGTRSWTGGTTTKHQLQCALYAGSDRQDSLTMESVVDQNGAAWARVGLFAVVACAQGTVIRVKGDVQNVTTRVTTNIRIKKIF